MDDGSFLSIRKNGVQKINPDQKNVNEKCEKYPHLIQYYTKFYMKSLVIFSR